METSDPTLTDVEPDPVEQEGGTAPQGVAASSCADEGPGRSNCGVNADESCCDSPLVSGGTYFRTYENYGDGPTAQADEATITSFRLDKYEVSVGRFRRFVEYLSNGGAPPEAGSGKHTHVNGGEGLTDSGAPGSFESGWDASWNERIPSGDGAAAEWQSLLATGVNGSSGCGLYGTWTEEPGENEELPITCTSWYESYAFCIWDGGFLPSEAEWKYAAAGGEEHRMYPWGTAELGSENEYAIYDCCYPNGECNASADRDTCTGTVNAAPVGFASLGAGRYGQVDLIGNVFEWLLDKFDDYESPCEDCALLSASTSDRVLPGSGFHTGLGLGSTVLYSWNRAAIAYNAETFRGDYAVGLRCARSP